ncbi:MAG: ImmA/IrrE family metallo-endopeptidase [Candidatus Neomarinimicrobiota bacterium]
MTNILPPRLSWDHIRDEAEKFRQEYVRPPDKIPVPIIEIAEIDLNIRINPQPGLRHRSDVEAFLESDLRTLCIDQDLYEDPRQEKRLRFTFAHEIGHLILHRIEISQIQFAGIEEWVDFRIKMKEEDNRWFESQAYEFAGRLLVPRNQLIDKIKEKSDGIQKYRDIADDEEALKDAISKLICDDFFVSAAVIYRRINAEKIWDELSM